MLVGLLLLLLTWLLLLLLLWLHQRVCFVHPVWNQAEAAIGSS